MCGHPQRSGLIQALGRSSLFAPVKMLYSTRQNSACFQPSRFSRSSSTSVVRICSISSQSGSKSFSITHGHVAFRIAACRLISAINSGVVYLLNSSLRCMLRPNNSFKPTPFRRGLIQALDLQGSLSNAKEEEHQGFRRLVH